MNVHCNFFLEFKQYCARHLPDVTKQCTSNQLIPSLLFKPCPPNVTSLSYLSKINSIEKTDQSWSNINTENEFKTISTPTEISENQNADNTKPTDAKEAENLTEKLLEDVKLEKDKITELQNELQNLNVKKKQVSYFCCGQFDDFLNFIFL